ncbi:DUF6252 family protein [Marinilabilia sp.]|uniref:DUF6252 family protein n=1 Tax=Marinilabilia sp. TaxID=2021252 RepID=UPI0025BECE71|nr:DUF6252 family protein [Marinilabilia sp.]
MSGHLLLVNGSFTAQVNGEPWAAESVTALLCEQVNVINIYGETDNGVDISISMSDDVTRGNTYPLTGNGDYSANIYEAGETSSSHFSESGELTILKHDTENNIIEAEFYFKAKSQSSETVYDISEGEVSYSGYYVQ